MSNDLDLHQSNESFDSEDDSLKNYQVNTSEAEIEVYKFIATNPLIHNSVVQNVLNYIHSSGDLTSEERFKVRAPVKFIRYHENDSTRITLHSTERSYCPVCSRKEPAGVERNLIVTSGYKYPCFHYVCYYGGIHKTSRVLLYESQISQSEATKIPISGLDWKLSDYSIRHTLKVDPEEIETIRAVNYPEMLTQDWEFRALLEEQDGHARLVVNYAKDKIITTNDEIPVVHTYDKKTALWSRRSKRFLADYIIQVLKKIADKYFFGICCGKDEKLEKKYNKILTSVKSKCRTVQWANKVADLVISRTYREGFEFGNNRDILPIRGKLIIELNTGLTRERRREDYCDYECPVDWNSRISISVAEKFLNDIMLGDQEMVDFIQKVFGYSLTGHTREQKIFFLCNVLGSNGKSTLMKIMDSILGSRFYYTMSKNSLSKMKIENPEAATPFKHEQKGKRLAVIPDISKCTLDDSSVKVLGGGDKQASRENFGKPAQWEQTAKVFILCNHSPNYSDVDGGLLRKLVMIYFPAHFVENPINSNEKLMIKGLEDELMKEHNKSAFLLLFVRGSVKWYREGLVLPESVKVTTVEYKKEIDSVAQFIQDGCEEKEGKIRASELRDAYVTWCEMNGKVPVGPKIFGIQAKNHCRGGKDNRGIYYSNIEISIDIIREMAKRKLS